MSQGRTKCCKFLKGRFSCFTLEITNVIGKIEEENPRPADDQNAGSSSHQNHGDPSDPNANGGSEQFESATPRFSDERPLDYIQIFNFMELERAVNGFNFESRIGDGEFGNVYRGMLPTGQIVAVKLMDAIGYERDRQFLHEIVILSLLCHPNLVTFIGFCAERPQRVLVYEFMPQGSVDHHLHPDMEKNLEPLDWQRRVEIALGAAKGLHYLHTEANPPIIFRDFKTSNILLDENFRPKITDFGHAMFAPPGPRMHDTTRPIGNAGYTAPEYFVTGMVTEKSDVYSFGAVLLELITGKRPGRIIGRQTDITLFSWLFPMKECQDKLFEAVDPVLNGRYVRVSVCAAADLALRCLRTSPLTRPGMGDVVREMTLIVSDGSSNQSVARTTIGEGSTSAANARETLLAARVENRQVAAEDPRKRTGTHQDKASDQGDALDQNARATALTSSFGRRPIEKAQIFSFRELKKAANNFRQESKIGEGGFGPVYKGILQTGQIVAVKKLNVVGQQGDREFLYEIIMLSLLRHPNLVNLIGFCAERPERLLVYEFMPLRSLDNHLHDLKPGSKPLDWQLRMTIALGTARGMNYLHNEATPSVIFGDLKTSSILLDKMYHPKLSDFGLAKFDGDQTHVTTRIIDSQLGYCAPEYYATGRLTKKSDVYAFGVVLLELITGRRPTDIVRKQPSHMLYHWLDAMRTDRSKLYEAVDPRLKGQYKRVSLCGAADLALQCLRRDPVFRPGMCEVVRQMKIVNDWCSAQTV